MSEVNSNNITINNNDINKYTVWGYLRVSTNKQHVETNKGEILRFSNEKGLYPVIFIQETVSGRKDWRNRLLGKMFFDKFKKGDYLIMTEYSRIGRDFLQSMEFLSECKRKGVFVLSTLGDIPVNSDDSTSNLLLAVNAWKSQIERESISYRTKLKLEQLKALGVKLGRKNKMILEGKTDNDLNDNKKKISDMIQQGVKLKFIAKNLNCTVMTLRKFIVKYDLNKK